MNRYYRSRDGAWYTVIDRDFKIPISHSRYREQADLVVSALNQQELQHVASKHTSELIKSVTATVEHAIDDSGILVPKCDHGTPFNLRCVICEDGRDESQPPPRG